MISLEEAYTEACRQLGEANVHAAILTRQLAAVTAERDEAGSRITELLLAAAGDDATADVIQAG